MKKTDIEEFQTQLGEHYLMIKEIWESFCLECLLFECADPLGTTENPIGECTTLQKILLACIAHLQADDQRIPILVKMFLFTVYNHYRIPQGTIIKIRKAFLIVVER